jgi:hypothetical protein
MNKIMLFVALLIVASLRPAFAATPPVTFPTTAQNAYLNDQVVLTLINHGSFAEEYRQGQKQIILSDNFIEAGHIGAQYIVALDGSFYQNPLTSGLNEELGIRLNLHSFLNRYVTFTPQYNAVLSNLEVYPRILYDFGQSSAHAWNATMNLGFGFGVGAGVPAQ